MRRILFNILLILSAVLLIGCQQNSVMPDEVARNYWSAVQSGNSSTLKNLTINNNGVNEERLMRSLHLKNFKIRRTIIEENNAIVEVDLELENAGSVPVPIDTVLIKQDQSWFVDHKTTLASLRKKSDIGDAIAELHKFSRLFSRELDQSLNQLEQQAPAIRRSLVDLMQKITARAPVLKKELEILIEEIDKTVKPLIEKHHQVPNQTEKLLDKTPASSSSTL
ncbi:MAG: hypothetical protein V3U88_11150 [Methylococcales bacterium]